VVHNVRPARSRHVARYVQQENDCLMANTAIKSTMAHSSNFMNLSYLNPKILMARQKSTRLLPEHSRWNGCCSISN